MTATSELELIRLTARYVEGAVPFHEPYEAALDLVPALGSEEAGGRLGRLVGALLEAEVTHPVEGEPRRRAVAEALEAFTRGPIVAN